MRILLASTFALATLATLTLRPTVADASGCYRGPFGPQQLPLGCPITIYSETTSEPPVVLAARDGVVVDITGAVSKSTTSLDVGHPEYDCNGDIENVTLFPTPYDLYSVTVPDAVLGDNLLVNGLRMHVVEAGPCVELARPEPLCGYVPDRCEPDEIDENKHGAGCDAGGGGAGLAAALAALVLAMRARR